MPFLCHRRLEVPYTCMKFGLLKAHTWYVQIRRKRLRVSGALTRQKGTDLLLRLDTERASVPWDNPLSFFELIIGHGESQRGSSRLDIGPSAVCLIPLLLRRFSTNPEKYLHHEVQRRHRRLPRNTRHQRKCCCRERREQGQEDQPHAEVGGHE